MVNDNYSRVVSRNYTNQAEVSDAGLPSSAFDMSYQSWFHGVIGRLIVAAYQHVMPGTKYRGTNSIAPTFEQFSTPQAPDMMQRVHNFYTPDFSVNRDFRDIMTANVKNNYNRSTTIGAFSPAAALKSLMQSTNLKTLWTSLVNCTNTSNTTAAQIGGICSSATLASWLPFSTASLITNLYTDVYISGALTDLNNQIIALRPGLLSMLSTDPRGVVRAVAKVVLDFFVGEGSLFDMLGYPYVSHDNLEGVIKGFAAGNTATEAAVAKWLFYNNSTSEPLFSDTALRKYHAIWIAFYRNVQIQPILSNALDYHKWDNTLTLGTSTASNVTITSWFLMMFITRICPWSEDMFTSAQLDDIMRHVYTPVMTDVDDDMYRLSSPNINGVEDPSMAVGGRFMTLQDLSYKDIKGVSSKITLPIPSILNRSLNALNYSNTDQYGPYFDLFTLKRAHMLERFLKRGHYFGTDEYRDIIKGQYGVDISDLRLNRPHFLGGSTALVDKQQHISQSGNTTTEGSGSFGQRLVTATGNITGDTFTDFAEEWGSVFSLYSIIPQVQYDPLCIQNTQIYVTDFPVPVLTQEMETIIPTMALNRNKIYLDAYANFGHAPAAYQYRSRVNEVHGKFLDEYSDYVCARFFGNQPDTTPRLNSMFLECRPYLGAFMDTVLLDGQFYCFSDHKFYVECPLPAPVEVI